MEWLKLGIPLFVAVCGGMYMYLVHDSKLKKQEALLNAFRLNEIMEKEREKLKARITIEKVMKDSFGNLVITNTGESEANNVEIEIKKSINVQLEKLTSLELLRPNESIKLKLTLLSGIQNRIDMIIKWDDLSQKGRIHEQTINL